MVLINYNRWVLLINLEFCAVEYLIWLLPTVAMVSIETTWTHVARYLWFWGDEIFDCLVGDILDLVIRETGIFLQLLPYLPQIRGLKWPWSRQMSLWKCWLSFLWCSLQTCEVGKWCHLFHRKVSVLMLSYVLDSNNKNNEGTENFLVRYSQQTLSI